MSDALTELNMWLWLADRHGKSPPELMALARGVELVTFDEVGGGKVSVKPDRVARLERRKGRYGERTAVFFTPGGDDAPVLVDDDVEHVAKRLHRAGWKGKAPNE